MGETKKALANGLVMLDAMELRAESYPARCQSLCERFGDSHNRARTLARSRARPAFSGRTKVSFEAPPRDCAGCDVADFGKRDSRCVRHNGIAAYGNPAAYFTRLIALLPLPAISRPSEIRAAEALHGRH